MYYFFEGVKMKCPICKDKGYVFKKSFDWAKIEKCECSYHCQICGDFGHTAVYKDGYRYLKKCDCKKLDEKIKRYNDSKIPSRYSNKKISNFKTDMFSKVVAETQKGILKKIQNYIDNFDKDSKGIILYGSNGVGKTHLLTSLLAHLVLNFEITGLYLDFPQWILENKHLFYTSDDSLKEKLMQEMEIITKVDILVIDEFAKNRTDFEKDIFERIFYERYNKRKIIFIGTNYEITNKGNGKYMGEVVSPALFSRLGDFNSFEANLLIGDDYRLN
jgi:DNA replication protein DnaC